MIVTPTFQLNPNQWVPHGSLKSWVGLHTIPSDGYGHTLDGQVMGMVNHRLSVKSGQQIPDGYGMGTCHVTTVRGWTRIESA